MEMWDELNYSFSFPNSTVAPIKLRMWLKYALSTCFICCSLILRLECFHVFQGHCSICKWYGKIVRFQTITKYNKMRIVCIYYLTMLFFILILMISQYTSSVQGSVVSSHNWIYASIKESSSIVPYEEFNTVFRMCYFTLWILAATVVYLVNVKCINITHNLIIFFWIEKRANKSYLHN